MSSAPRRKRKVFVILATIAVAGLGAHFLIQALTALHS